MNEERSVEGWQRANYNLQREKNEQYEENKTLKALVKLLVAFICHDIDD